MNSSDFLSSPCGTSFNGDYIGVESCVDVLKDGVEDISRDGEDDDDDLRKRQRRLSRRDQRLSSKKKKEFPPPISLLARTENQPSHMPWVLKRHYTSDGRLILTEERVKHHEYFRAHRSNGRLTLQLVPLDDDVLALDHHFQMENNALQVEVEEEMVEAKNGKCCIDYGSVRSNSGLPRIFGVPLPAISPLHT